MEHAYTVIVDAMLGIGLSRDIEGRYAGIIGWINAQRGRTKIVAVDMPSGVSADSGHVLGTAVSADLTVTFAARKPGQLLYPGAEYCGRLICRPIGVVCRQPRADRPCPQTGERESFCAEDVAFTCTDLDLARIAPRRASSNKGSYGKILLIAGSCGMSGAACLAARAAYRSGSGMVRVFTPECNRTVIQTALPEALVTSWKPGEAAEEKERAAFEWSDAAGIGPGLGQSGEARRLLWLALAEYEKPLVLDADALNLLAGSSEFLRKARAPVIVTPHIGEMARLCGSPKEEIKADPQGIAKRFAAAYHVICVLKDARTVVSDGQRVYINTSGNHGMATAGSGDVLTGVILGLLGQGMGAFEAAVLGVYLHGRAGDLAREKEGAYGLMAGDLPEQVAQVLKIAERMNAGEQKAAEWRKR